MNWIDRFRSYADAVSSSASSSMEGFVIDDRNVIDDVANMEENNIDSEAAGQAKAKSALQAKSDTSSQNNQLERKAVVELIERVNIYMKGRIEVVFRYHNEFVRLCDSLDYNPDNQTQLLDNQSQLQAQLNKEVA